MFFKLDASFFLEKSSLATSMSKVADETIYAYSNPCTCNVQFTFYHHAGGYSSFLFINILTMLPCASGEVIFLLFLFNV